MGKRGDREVMVRVTDATVIISLLSVVAGTTVSVGVGNSSFNFVRA
jgi:hypothetical protein